VVITYYQDKSFTFEMKTPPVSYFLKKAAKIKSGSKTPGKRRRPARSPKPRCARSPKKMKDLNANDVEAAMKMVEGSARSMGLEVWGLRSWQSWQNACQEGLREGVDRDKLYSLDEAVKLVKERAKAKFDETIEIAMNLGVDPRHADQMVRGVVNLPNGTGRTCASPCSPSGAKADEAKAAGADIVGAEDLVREVKGGKIDFDRCIATPDMMGSSAVSVRCSARAA
jgi:hypothetical protein